MENESTKKSSGRKVMDGDLDAYVRRWMVEMMGEDDARVSKWDKIVAAYGPRK